MTAAAERARLAEIGGDLARLVDGSGLRRARALFGGAPEEPVGFADLSLAPVWLRRSRPQLIALANAAALIAMGPVIAASIDGDWLGDLAAHAGEPALDRAIALAGDVPEGGLPPVSADAAEGLGFDLVRAVLPSPLRRYVAWAPVGSVPVTAALASFCVRAASDG